MLKSSPARSEEHTSELQSRGHLVCRLLLEKKKQYQKYTYIQTSNEQDTQKCTELGQCLHMSALTIRSASPTFLLCHQHSCLSFFFFFYCSGAPRDLHSFPTRRSSDLAREHVVHREVYALVRHVHELHSGHDVEELPG